MNKIALVIALLVCCTNMAFGQERMLGEYEIQYVTDSAEFYTEDQEDFPEDMQRPLEFAKAVLAAYLKEEIRGRFSIARASHGYQVNFSNLRYKTEEEEWEQLLNGFGEVFMSPMLNRIQIDMGS